MPRLPILVVSVLTGCGACLVAGCTRTPATAEPVRIFAAASTREAIEAIAEDFQTETGVHVEPNFGPSSELARQIEQGAPADLFLSADELWADFISTKGLSARRQDLLANELVVVIPVRSELAIKDLADLAEKRLTRIALAGETVPAGRYARHALSRVGTLDRLRDRIIEGSDVRAALAYVVQGEADAGIVYATDARDNNAVRVALKIPSKLHEPIRYPLVLIKREPTRARAARLFEYLSSEKASRRFRDAGFGVVSSSAVEQGAK